ncbi:MAG: hypothetical protein GY792_20940 [Gammaproteobacteria bacterium]|nr:hypothetical protein [Gammaproteobacteria bacterium]
MATMQRSKLRDSVQTWKQKAIRRGKQLKQAHKRLRDLVQSRDRWKRKAQTRQARILQLHAEVQRLTHAKKNLRPPLSIYPQPSDDPDVSGPEVADVVQFSSRLEEQCHRPSVSEGAPPNGSAEHDSPLGAEARVLFADTPKRAGRRLDHLSGS